MKVAALIEQAEEVGSILAHDVRAVSMRAGQHEQGKSGVTWWRSRLHVRAQSAHCRATRRLYGLLTSAEDLRALAEASQSGRRGSLTMFISDDRGRGMSVMFAYAALSPTSDP